MRRRPRPTLWLALLATAGTAFAAGTPGATAATPTPRAEPGRRRAGRSGRAVALRPGPQGLPGHRPEHGSKVWFTVAGGVLSDVYYPTIDTTNVETLQFVVTDGTTFTDLQTRDTTYTAAALDPTGMSCRVTSTAQARQLHPGHRLPHRPGRATAW